MGGIIVLDDNYDNLILFIIDKKKKNEIGKDLVELL